MRVLALYILLGTLSGCHHELYGGPANVRDSVSVPADGFHSQYVFVGDDGRVPRPVEQLRAACQNANLCDAIVVPPAGNTRWPELRVIPKAPGKTHVTIDFVHPGRNKREQHRMAIEVIASPAPAPIALGAAVPARRTDLAHHVNGAIVGHCDQLESPRDIVNGHERGDVKIYACSALVEAAPTTKRYRVCNGMCPSGVDEHYFLCATEERGVVASASVLQYKHAPRSSELEVKVVEGMPLDGVCTPAPQT